MRAATPSIYFLRQVLERWASHARISYSERLPSRFTHSIPHVQIPYQSRGLQLLTFPRTIQSPPHYGGDRRVIYEPVDLNTGQPSMQSISLGPGGARSQGSFRHAEYQTGRNEHISAVQRALGSASSCPTFQVSHLSLACWYCLHIVMSQCDRHRRVGRTHRPHDDN